MKRAFVSAAVLAASLSATGCGRVGVTNGAASGRPADDRPRYEVGLLIGVDSAASVEAALHGCFGPGGFAPPDRYSVKWSLWPLFGQVHGPIEEGWFAPPQRPYGRY